MQEYFASLVRIYSKYNEQIPAPLGFDTPSRSLETSKWQHFPMNGNLMFLIVKEHENSYVVKILWNEVILEHMRVGLIGSDKIVQFTARSPIISCKYVVRENSMAFIKRFQIVLHNDEEFGKACAALSGLRFVVRSARAGIPQGSQVPQTLPTLMVGRIDHKFHNEKSPKHTSSETVPERIMPTSHNEKLPCGPHPSYRSKWESQVCKYGYPVSTQIALDDFQQTQLFMPSEDDMLRNENGLRSNLPMPEDRNQPIAETKWNQYSNIIQGAIVAAPVKLSVAVEENLTSKSSTDENSARPNESNLSPLREETTLNEESSSLLELKNKVGILDKNRANPSDAHIESERKNQPNESTAKVKKNKHSQNMKISKKLIKLKLQDDNFMQWVTKVEAVLSNMTKSKG